MVVVMAKMEVLVMMEVVVVVVSSSIDFPLIAHSVLRTRRWWQCWWRLWWWRRSVEVQTLL